MDLRKKGGSYTSNNPTRGPTLVLHPIGVHNITSTHHPCNETVTLTPLSHETPPPNLTSKTGLPTHFRSDSIHNNQPKVHTLLPPLTHNPHSPLSQKASTYLDPVPLVLALLRSIRLLLRHSNLWEHQSSVAAVYHNKSNENIFAMSKSQQVQNWDISTQISEGPKE